jgi:hypothetical protein
MISCTITLSFSKDSNCTIPFSQHIKVNVEFIRKIRRKYLPILFIMMITHSLSNNNFHQIFSNPHPIHALSRWSRLLKSEVEWVQIQRNIARTTHTFVNVSSKHINRILKMLGICVNGETTLLNVIQELTRFWNQNRLVTIKLHWAQSLENITVKYWKWNGPGTMCSPAATSETLTAVLDRLHWKMLLWQNTWNNGISSGNI